MGPGELSVVGAKWGKSSGANSQSYQGRGCAGEIRNQLLHSGGMRSRWWVIVGQKVEKSGKAWG